MVFNNRCVLVLWTEIASLYGLRHSSRGTPDMNECLRAPLGIVVWNYNTFANIFVIEDDFTKYSKESCW